MNTKLYVCIINQTRNGNGFGDLILSVTVEMRSHMHEVLDRRTFSDYAFEGEHVYAYTRIQQEIEQFAKSCGTVFTGCIG